jgi:hypothetical protein
VLIELLLLVVSINIVTGIASVLSDLTGTDV